MAMSPAAVASVTMIEIPAEMPSMEQMAPAITMPIVTSRMRTAMCEVPGAACARIDSRSPPIPIDNAERPTATAAR